ncbi:hypothetical protein [Nostoc sp.]
MRSAIDTNLTICPVAIARHSATRRSQLQSLGIIVVSIRKL